MSVLAAEAGGFPLLTSVVVVPVGRRGAHRAGVSPAAGADPARRAAVHDRHRRAHDRGARRVQEPRRRLPARRQDALDQGPRHLLDARRRRHLAVAGRAHRHPVPDRAARRAAAPRREAVLRVAAPARGRLPRRVPRARPLPVLRDVRDRARADVLPHQRLGLRRTAVRRDQVLPVHDVRLGVHAGRHDRARVPARQGRSGHVRPADPRRAAGHGGGDHRPLAVPVVRHRVRGEGAAVPGAHLAARRPHPGADRRLGDPGRRHAEARHLRVPALRPLPVPRGVGVLRAVHGHARRDRHHLRRHLRRHAEGPEAARRVLVGGPPRLHRARHVRPHHPGPAGRRAADGQPRRLHRRAVPPRRHDLRAPPHPPDLRAQGAAEVGADHGRRCSPW